MAVRVLDDLIRTQCGVLTRVQALEGGLTKAQIEARLASGRWRRVSLGVYLTFTGPPPRRSQLWAALLRVGTGAVLSHDTAAEVAGLVEPSSSAIHVTVPTDRSPVRVPGIVIHRSIHIARCRHPAKAPPQTRIEETVIDLTQIARCLDDALAWLARAVGSRLTTPDRLAASMRARPKLRWRQALTSALIDVDAGCQSLIELRYLRDVERAHRLPPSLRQVRRDDEARYDDVVYRDFRVRVELDGRAAHPDHERWRDMRRDNSAVVHGDHVLRYGPADIEGVPCLVAEQVARVLRQNSWPGNPRRCARAGCTFRDRGRWYRPEPVPAPGIK